MTHIKDLKKMCASRTDCLKYRLSVDDSGLFKLYQSKTKSDKFPSTPVRCFIDNEDVNGKSVPYKLDRQFYINMAKEGV